VRIRDAVQLEPRVRIDDSGEVEATVHRLAAECGCRVATIVRRTLIPIICATALQRIARLTVGAKSWSDYNALRRHAIVASALQPIARYLPVATASNDAQGLDVRLDTGKLQAMSWDKIAIPMMYCETSAI
jgi:hypothetical protein